MNYFRRYDVPNTSPKKPKQLELNPACQNNFHAYEFVKTIEASKINQIAIGIREITKELRAIYQCRYCMKIEIRPANGELIEGIK